MAFQCFLTTIILSSIPTLNFSISCTTSNNKQCFGVKIKKKRILKIYIIHLDYELLLYWKCGHKIINFTWIKYRQLQPGTKLALGDQQRSLWLWKFFEVHNFQLIQNWIWRWARSADLIINLYHFAVLEHLQKVLELPDQLWWLAHVTWRKNEIFPFSPLIISARANKPSWFSLVTIVKNMKAEKHQIFRKGKNDFFSSHSWISNERELSRSSNRRMKGFITISSLILVSKPVKFKTKFLTLCYENKN